MSAVVDSNATNDDDELIVDGSVSIKDEITGNTAKVGAKGTGEQSLHTISETTLIHDSAANPPCPVLSCKLRIDSSDTEVDLNKLSESYNSIYSYSGTGKFGGFIINFNSPSVILKVTVDSNVLFEIDCDILDMLKVTAPNGWLDIDNSKDVVSFHPLCPIKYETNITIEAKANSESAQRDMNQYLVYLTKES